MASAEWVSDYFWENKEGYFSDQSSQRGFLNPSYIIIQVWRAGVWPGRF
jgi:hypothetical protein